MTTQAENAEQLKANLSPPWFTTQRSLAFTIGQSSQVMVSDIIDNGHSYSVILTGQSADVAQALANVVTSAYDFGGVKLSLTFMDKAGNKYKPMECSKLQCTKDLKTVLVGNSLVYDVEETVILCFPNVMQYFNDNFADPSQFTFKIASEGFNEVMISAVTAYTLSRRLSNQ